MSLDIQKELGSSGKGINFKDMADDDHDHSVTLWLR